MHFVPAIWEIDLPRLPYTGSFLEPKDIRKLFDGAYGAFVNTDSFTVGAAVEMHAAFVIVRGSTIWSNFALSMHSISGRSREPINLGISSGRTSIMP